MNYMIGCIAALVNEKGEEIPLKAVDFALLNSTKMICGVPMEFE